MQKEAAHLLSASRGGKPKLRDTLTKPSASAAKQVSPVRDLKILRTEEVSILTIVRRGAGLHTEADCRGDGIGNNDLRHAELDPLAARSECPDAVHGADGVDSRVEQAKAYIRIAGQLQGAGEE